MGLAHGTHGWSDVAVPDMEAGEAFYGGLFGWVPQHSGASESMPYTMFSLDGDVVAGMGPLSQGQIDAGQHPVWSCYIIVDDVDDVFARAVALGATPLVEPMTIMDTGSMAFVLDPVGAPVGFWQSGTHDGALVFNEPNSVTWNDLATRDLEAAKAFYTELLGWEASETDTGGTMDYWTVTNRGRMNGGVWDMTGILPPDVPSHWLTWFRVADCRMTADRVVELGGSVQREPQESDIGISAVVTDPFGAVFGIIETDQVDGQPPR